MESSQWSRHRAQQCCPDPASPGQLSSAFRAAVFLCAGSTGPGLASLGTLWLRREGRPALDLPPPGGGSPSTNRLCAVTRGLQGGTAPRLSSAHKPHFLSVVLKESVESADWAVLLHPRSVRLRLLAGRGGSLWVSHLICQLTPPRLQGPPLQSGGISVPGH